MHQRETSPLVRQEIAMPHYYEGHSKITTSQKHYCDCRLCKRGIEIETRDRLRVVIAKTPAEAKRRLLLEHEAFLQHDGKGFDDFKIVKRKATAVRRDDLPGNEYFIQPEDDLPILTIGEYETNSIILIHRDLAFRREERLPDSGQPENDDKITRLFADNPPAAPAEGGELYAWAGHLAIRFMDGSMLRKVYYDTISTLGFRLHCTGSGEMFVITDKKGQKIGLVMGMNAEMREKAEPYQSLPG